MLVVRICDNLIDNMERYIPVYQIKEINRDCRGTFLIKTEYDWHTCYNGEFKIIDIECEAERKGGQVHYYGKNADIYVIDEHIESEVDK